MPKIRCAPCGGSGRVMGGGMILTDCDACDGHGKIYVEEKKNFEIDKNSKHYKEAIHKIKQLKKGMTDDEADVIFSEELKNVNANSEVKTVY